MKQELARRKQEIIEEFEMFDDWMEKYEYIIDLGKDLPIIDADDKVDDNLIKGCQSNVWLSASSSDGIHVRFKADSDAIITKGLIALMIRYFDHLPGDVIAKANPDFIQEIGLHDHLSPTRSNGLVSMIKQMKIQGISLTAK
tara:strand:+ start:145 stop:570 length:426 start_codon:yes stop_codon:yes gene_type:complete